MQLRIRHAALFAACTALTACAPPAESRPARLANSDDADAGPGAQPCAPDAGPDIDPPTDFLSPTRLLRRVAVVLTGHGPARTDVDAMMAAEDDSARDAVLDGLVDRALQSTAFYDQLLVLGHDWLRTGRYTTGAVGDTYYGHMSGSLWVCPDSSAHPGALYVSGDASSSDTVDVCDDATVTAFEPWWAPGTSVDVVGRAAHTVQSHPAADGNGTYTCGFFEGTYFTPGNGDDGGEPACGCGPNLVYCHPGQSGFAQTETGDDTLQRRMMWDEPARLFAHIAWHDRPLTDVIAGNYSVGPNKLRHLYVRQARQDPALLSLDANTAWWRNTDAVPADPHHDAHDPMAWREFTVADVNPHLLAARDYSYDPRTTTEPPLGVPAAGVLTTFGSQSTFARERVRAARWLEIFACRQFVPPPSDVVFQPFNVDPATTGTCQHCHASIDPAAIFFKRWDFGEHDVAPTPMMPGVGPWLYPTDYTVASFPWARWKNSWLPNTVLTPVTESDIAFNPYAIILDTLPAGQTLLGTEGDGTVGPLGFAKVLIASGDFDRCAAKTLAERVLGRRIDPANESGYLGALTRSFVASDRKLRPFVKALIARPEMRRGL